MNQTAIVVRIADGQVVWRRDDLPARADGYSRIDGSDLVVTNGLGGERYDLHTGEPHGQADNKVPAKVTAITIDPTPPPKDLKPDTIFGGPVAAGDLDVSILGSLGPERTLVAYNRATGDKVWSVTLDRYTHSVPLISGDLVAVTTGDKTCSDG